MKEQNKNRLVEIISRIDKDFINEVTIVKSTPDTTPQKPTEPPPVQQPQQNNKQTEFRDAFKNWFGTLGYKPENKDVSIMKINTEIENVLKDLGYR
jgi:hypothetical protein